MRYQSRYKRILTDKAAFCNRAAYTEAGRFYFERTATKMLEILFRGKRKSDGKWVVGNLFIPDKPETPTQICVGTNVVRITYDIDPETVGQYTGLTDKNGNKIFEGDIILYGLIPCVVKYDLANARFMIYEKGEYLKNGFNIDTMKMKEVAGNVHDNPELLGGANNG